MQVRVNVIFVSLIIQLHYLIISTVSSEAAFTNSTSKFHRKCSLMSLTSSSLQTSVSHIFHVHPLSTCLSFVLLCCFVSVEKYKNKQNKASQFFCVLCCAVLQLCVMCVDSEGSTQRGRDLDKACVRPLLFLPYFLPQF